MSEVKKKRLRTLLRHNFNLDFQSVSLFIYDYIPKATLRSAIGLN